MAAGNPDIERYEDLDPRKATELQRSLRQKIKLAPLEDEVKTVGGADLSYDRGSNRVHAGITVLSLPGLELRSWSLYTTEVSFPYVPGLLAFRELPPLWKAWEQCRKKPDVLILDGHGLAHPRRMGVATHFGVLADHPTVGCAKNVLTGDYKEPGIQKGNYSWLIEENEKIGMALRSRTKVNPIYVSPGHRMDFEGSLRIVKSALGKYKLPETTRTAHRLVNERRKGKREDGYRETRDDSPGTRK